MTETVTRALTMTVAVTAGALTAPLVIGGHWHAAGSVAPASSSSSPSRVASAHILVQHYGEKVWHWHARSSPPVQPSHGRDAAGAATTDHPNIITIMMAQAPIDWFQFRGPGSCVQRPNSKFSISCAACRDARPAPARQRAQTTRMRHATDKEKKEFAKKN